MSGLKFVELGAGGKTKPPAQFDPAEMPLQEFIQRPGFERAAIARSMVPSIRRPSSSHHQPRPNAAPVGRDPCVGNERTVSCLRGLCRAGCWGEIQRAAGSRRELAPLAEEEGKPLED